MISLENLSTLDAEVLELLKRGYSSEYVYHVTKTESREKITFTAELCKRDQTFNKSWTDSYTKGGIDFYTKMASQGASIAAKADGVLAGVAIVEPRHWNNSLWIWEFHVSASFRRQGIGLMMMNHLDQVGREMGFRIMSCEVQNTNVPALDFYRTAGFELEGIDLSLYSNDPGRNGEVAFFMKRKLD